MKIARVSINPRKPRKPPEIGTLFFVFYQVGAQSFQQQPQCQQHLPPQPHQQLQLLQPPPQ